MMMDPYRFSRFERGTRYYELRVQQDIFGQWVLLKIWGRKGTALGHMRTFAYPSHADAVLQWEVGLQTRLKRG